MSKVITAPCKDCTKRQLHCHSICEDYKAYREYRQSVSKEKMKIIDEKDFIKAVKSKAAHININHKMRERQRRK
jgi:hypothetical protein